MVIAKFMKPVSINKELLYFLYRANITVLHENEFKSLRKFDTCITFKNKIKYYILQ